MAQRWASMLTLGCGVVRRACVCVCVLYLIPRVDLGPLPQEKLGCPPVPPIGGAHEGRPSFLVGGRREQTKGRIVKRFQVRRTKANTQHENNSLAGESPPLWALFGANEPPSLPEPETRSIVRGYKRKLTESVALTLAPFSKSSETTPRSPPRAPYMRGVKLT